MGIAVSRPWIDDHLRLCLCPPMRRNVDVVVPTSTDELATRHEDATLTGVSYVSSTTAQ